VHGAVGSWELRATHDEGQRGDNLRRGRGLMEEDLLF